MDSYLQNLELIDAPIVKRGKKYFDEGRVQILSKTPTQVVAQVSGSEEYQVAISFNAKKVLQNSACTCPCDFTCKHVAAVLYELDQEERLEGLKKGKAPTDLKGWLQKIQDCVASKDRYAFEAIGYALPAYFLSFGPDDSKAVLATYFSAMGQIPRLSDMDGIILNLLKKLKLNLEEETLFLKDFFTKAKNDISKQRLFACCYRNEAFSHPLEKAFLAAGAPNELTRYLPSDYGFYTYDWNNYSLPLNIFILKHEENFFLNVDKLNECRPLVKEGISPQEVEYYLLIQEVNASNHGGSYLDPEDATKLKNLGFIKEAHQLSFMVLEANNSFPCCYQYLSSLPSLESLSMADYKELGELALEGEYLEAFNLYLADEKTTKLEINNHLNLEDIYLCKDRIPPQFRERILDYVRKRCASLNHLVRARDDLFYGLRYLAFMKDAAVDPLLLEEATEKHSLENPSYRATYLSLLLERHLLEKKDLHLYEESQHVSQ